MPEVEECPRGSVSRVLNMRTHAQSAYCAPDLCAAGEAQRSDGATCTVVELEIVAHPVYPPAPSHGALAPRTSLRDAPRATLFAEATAPCDAQDDEAPIQGARGTSAGPGMAGPRIETVPAGCHRVQAWVPADATAEAPTTTPPPAPTAAPAPTPTPTPARAPTAPPPQQPGAACSSTTRDGATGLVVVAVLALTLSARRRKRNA